MLWMLSGQFRRRINVTISDFLLLTASVLVWLLLMLIWPLLAVWLILPELVLISGMIIKEMWEDDL